MKVIDRMIERKRRFEANLRIGWKCVTVLYHITDEIGDQTPRKVNEGENRGKLYLVFNTALSLHYRIGYVFRLDRRLLSVLLSVMENVSFLLVSTSLCKDVLTSRRAVETIYYGCCIITFLQSPQFFK